MADFKGAEQYGERAEGGYADLDGGTYKGIARNFWPAWEGWAIIDSHMPLEHGEIINDPHLDSLVYQFFKTNFWDKMLGDGIDSTPFAWYFYDWYINSGAKAVKLLQEGLGIDPQTGHFGNITLDRVNAAGASLLLCIHTRRLRFYREHCIAVPEDTQFLKGWLARAINLYEILSSH